LHLALLQKCWQEIQPESGRWTLLVLPTVPLVQFVNAESTHFEDINLLPSAVK
jgi:hypothetical protein